MSLTPVFLDAASLSPEEYSQAQTAMRHMRCGHTDTREGASHIVTRWSHAIPSLPATLLDTQRTRWEAQRGGTGAAPSTIGAQDVPQGEEAGEGRERTEPGDVPPSVYAELPDDDPQALYRQVDVPMSEVRLRVRDSDPSANMGLVECHLRCLPHSYDVTLAPSDVVRWRRTHTTMTGASDADFLRHSPQVPVSVPCQVPVRWLVDSAVCNEWVPEADYTPLPEEVGGESAQERAVRARAKAEADRGVQREAQRLGRQRAREAKYAREDRERATRMQLSGTLSSDPKGQALPSLSAMPGGYGGMPGAYGQMGMGGVAGYGQTEQERVAERERETEAEEAAAREREAEEDRTLATQRALQADPSGQVTVTLSREIEADPSDPQSKAVSVKIPIAVSRLALLRLIARRSSDKNDAPIRLAARAEVDLHDRADHPSVTVCRPPHVCRALALGLRHRAPGVAAAGLGGDGYPSRMQHGAGGSVMDYLSSASRGPSPSPTGNGEGRGKWGYRDMAAESRGEGVGTDVSSESGRLRDRVTVVVPGSCRWYSPGVLSAHEHGTVGAHLGWAHGSRDTARETQYMLWRDAMIAAYRSDPTHRLSFTAVRGVLSGDCAAMLTVYRYLEGEGLINYTPSPRETSKDTAHGPNPIDTKPDARGETPRTRTCMSKSPLLCRAGSISDVLRIQGDPPLGGVSTPVHPMPGMRCTICACPLGHSADPEHGTHSAASPVCPERWHLVRRRVQADKDREGSVGPVPLDLCTACYKRYIPVSLSDSVPANKAVPPECVACDFVCLDASTSTGSTSLGTSSDGSPQWTPAELLLLVDGVGQGMGWDRVAEFIGTGRDPEACLLAYAGLTGVDSLGQAVLGREGHTGGSGLATKALPPPYVLQSDPLHNPYRVMETLATALPPSAVGEAVDAAAGALPESILPPSVCAIHASASTAVALLLNRAREVGASCEDQGRRAGLALLTVKVAQAEEEVSAASLEALNGQE
ncbi:hypothetical protein KIPB_003889 [Kipferlia bialata]|uniref:SWIRM domain-containing protein n=1 Tax=Kipferlia bialata TaxID=797122 RepID=A0A9K3CSW3_9EUKA|nr:hypothetical protein KIPB_003889 [Kipferlia bialata]|eukprot:g3889.t1